MNSVQLHDDDGDPVQYSQALLDEATGHLSHALKIFRSIRLMTLTERWSEDIHTHGKIIEAISSKYVPIDWQAWADVNTWSAALGATGGYPSTETRNAFWRRCGFETGCDNLVLDMKVKPTKAIVDGDRKHEVTEIIDEVMDAVGFSVESVESTTQRRVIERLEQFASLIPRVEETFGKLRGCYACGIVDPEIRKASGLHDILMAIEDSGLEIPRRDHAHSCGGPANEDSRDVDNDQHPCNDKAERVTSDKPTRKGRLRKAESELRRTQMLAELRSHPTLKDDPAKLATMVGVSESTARRWIDDEAEKYQSRNNRMTED
ncbi:hypothetical protein Pla100_57340 [Neorhodopirellula pilleata]|uniref:Uncharacterized protein n=2 Tax=Neorhodopirellula pilleata TaxID=2714738 RepID=A0A5C5ZKR3_9BACT|nr:hypothetical protein Pla100_57340 [Neorhodopirellula pilleata]